MSKSYTLGDIADFVNGLAFKPSDWHSEGKPIIRIQNLTNSEKPYNLTNRIVEPIYLVRKGDILVSWSATLGVFEWLSEDEGILNQHIFKVIPSVDLVDPRYLKYLLAEALRDMERHLHGSTMKHVNRGEFLGTKVFIPQIREQRRITAILDKADAIRRKRQEAVALAEQLLRSTYLDMFVNLESDTEWTTVESLAESRAGSIRTGPFGSQLLHSEFTDSGVAVLGIDNAVDNEFRWGRPRFISPEKYNTLRRYTVHPRDIIITIMGTCGRCAIIPDDIPTAINTKHLCCITFDKKKCLPEFLHSYFLFHPTAQSYLSKSAKGAIMDGLNMGIITQLPVPVVPLALQSHYQRSVAAVSALKRRLIASAVEADNLFNSLVQRAFTGQL